LKHIEIEFLLRTCNKPFALIMVGLPLCGKDTFVKSLRGIEYTEINRDKILMSCASNTNFNHAYTSANSKKIDKLVQAAIRDKCEAKLNIIINMTHLKKRKRHKSLSQIPENYYKIALQMPELKFEEFTRRNEKRYLEEGKKIKPSLYFEMTKMQEEVTQEEKFDTIIYFSTINPY